MRILFISNLYPPANLGGMELRLQEVVHGLQQKDHECHVLTSDFAPTGIEFTDQADVQRLLPLEANVTKYNPLEFLMQHPGKLRAGRETLQRIATSFEPDLVFFWGMWNFSPALIAEAKEHFPGPVVNSFAGYWPIEADTHEAYWHSEANGWLGQMFKKGIAPYALSRRYRPVKWSDLAFDHAIFCSKYVYGRLQAGGISFPHARIVFSGVDTDQFRPAANNEKSEAATLRILFPGTLVPHKGAHTVVEALALLQKEGIGDLSLTLVGRGQASYIGALTETISRSKLERVVSMIPAIPRESMPDLMRNSDIVVLATISEEPLSRVVMEGMASGVVVLASDTGGTAEMINDGEDGFLFNAGDSVKLARLIAQVAADNNLRYMLANNARKKAVDRFDLWRMIDDIESFLEEVITLQGGMK